MNVEIVALPAWTGGLIAAEYDRESDTVRVNALAIARIRAVLGVDGADDFVRCAVAHETFHRAQPSATEADAHRHVRASCGADPARFDAILRG